MVDVKICGLSTLDSIDAAIDAANKLKALMIAAAARRLDAEPGDIECLGEVYRAGMQDKGLTFEEVVNEALKDDGTITVTGNYSTIPESHGGKKYRGAAIGGTMGYSYSAQVVEVTVDEETGEREDDQACDQRQDVPTLPFRLQAAAGEGEDEQREGDECEGSEDDPCRELPIRVALVERAEEPQVADSREVGAGSVPGTPDQRDQPSEHERDTDRCGERDRRPLRLHVVGVDDQPDGGGGLESENRDRENQPAGLHGRSAETVSPQSSAFETKPSAPLASTSSP